VSSVLVDSNVLLDVLGDGVAFTAWSEFTAHAAVANYRLLTRDPARYRTYFPTVALITPQQNRQI
jgi:hypothetical protein